MISLHLFVWLAGYLFVDGINAFSIDSRCQTQFPNSQSIQHCIDVEISFIEFQSVLTSWFLDLLEALEIRWIESITQFNYKNLWISFGSAINSTTLGSSTKLEFLSTNFLNISQPFPLITDRIGVKKRRLSSFNSSVSFSSSNQWRWFSQKFKIADDSFGNLLNVCQSCHRPLFSYFPPLLIIVYYARSFLLCGKPASSIPAFH